MVILNMKLNHILCFNDFQICFSYPRKLKKTTIQNENLKAFPSFKYKKLNVFLGSNASGKTSLIKVIYSFLNFISKKEERYIKDIINPCFRESEAWIDFVDDQALHRMKIRTTENGKEDFRILLSHSSVELKQYDTYEKAALVLDEINDNYEDYLLILNRMKDIPFEWNMILPSTEENYDLIHFINTKDKNQERDYLSILNVILKTLDPSIIKITKSLDSDDALVVHQENEERIIIQSGNKITDIKRLSSGTKYGINLANMVFAIKYHIGSIYLIDEQFSYISSDIELAILTTMVELLQEDEQIFFTTHNQEILSYPFPFHSFYFLRKDLYGKGKEINVSCASDYENRNNVNLFNLAQNDVFKTAPDIDAIYKIADKKKENS